MIALDLSEDLRDELRPSDKLVLLVLRGADDAVDLDELADRTALPKETVRRRCKTLVEHDLATEHPYFTDARRVRFRATPSPDSGTVAR